jgi:hypothetical protein
MARGLRPILSAIMIALVGQAAASAAVVIDMPAPTRSDRPATYRGESDAPDVGTVALWRYANARELPEPAYAGWYGGCGPWHGGDSYGYGAWWGGYRTSLGWSHFYPHRLWTGGFACPTGSWTWFGH